MRQDVTIHETKIQYSLAWPHDGRVDMGLSPKVIKVTIMVKTLDPQKMKHRWEGKNGNDDVLLKTSKLLLQNGDVSEFTCDAETEFNGYETGKALSTYFLTKFFHCSYQRKLFQENDFLGVATITVSYLGPSAQPFLEPLVLLFWILGTLSFPWNATFHWMVTYVISWI